MDNKKSRNIQLLYLNYLPGPQKANENLLYKKLPLWKQIYIYLVLSNLPPMDIIKNIKSGGRLPTPLIGHCSLL